jgi:hypothetical protein
LYESHSVLHGRPFQLQGRFVANLFIHFEPVDSLQESSVVQDYDDKLTNLPKYILPESPEAARIKARPWNVSTPLFHSCYLYTIDKIQKFRFDHRQMPDISEEQLVHLPRLMMRQQRMMWVRFKKF